MASAILNPINSTLIAVALIPIGQAFGAGPERTAWLITSLYLATAVGQPVVGLFVDRFGARRVLLTGAAIVMVAGIGGLLTFSLDWLIGVRVVLGIGTCAGFPAAMAVLRKRADAAGQGVPSRILAVLAMSSQTVMVIGPTLGGALIGLFGWPAIFAVNIPLAAAALLFAVFWVPGDDKANLSRSRVDVLGIVLFSATLLAVLLFVMEPAVSDLYLLGVAVALAAAFTRVELRAAKPFIDLRMLAANTALLRTYLRQALAFLIVYSIMFGYVQWLESARGMTESGAGALLLPMSAVAVLAAAASGKPTGIRLRLILNSLALLAGSTLLLFVDTSTWLVALVGLAAVFGLGQGLTSVTNQTALYGQAPAEVMGTASGLFRTAQYLGAIAASTLIALCFGQHVTSPGLHHLGLALVVIGAALLAVTVFDRALRRDGARTQALDVAR
ncbi:multidrug efflux MFS transporter [Amycolatopsis sp. K13G38]|uniref:Multidrug efflux MFS transporter n=1 Tax=Amycolatopsis acididurans TaxID=2724524 RepID=A0ABX1JKX4_9PSEU|nr:MFS transporter [Amycolatopsis acididurans]NKQ58912.1 multidrug efflux MFS transporter [Amycolatopsis acididurans]